MGKETPKQKQAKDVQQPELNQPPVGPEKPVQKPPEAAKPLIEDTPEKGDLQKATDERLETYSEKTAEDIKTLRGSKIVDLRTKQFLLAKEPETNAAGIEKVKSAKEETARKLLAYTSGTEIRKDMTGTWYILNYRKVADGHEYGVGLGDILLDPDIQIIEIEKNIDGKKVKIKAQKAVVERGKKYGSRVGFVAMESVANFSKGEYIPTFSGEKFRIISGSETPAEGAAEVIKPHVDKYVSALTQDKKDREEYGKEYERQEKEYEHDKETAGPGGVNVGPDTIQSIDPATLSEYGKKLREVWPETRVPRNYWINLNDGVDKKTGLSMGQSFGPFQFYRKTFVDYMAFVRQKAPERWNKLSDEVKRKIMRQTEIFSTRKHSVPVSAEEIKDSFLTMAEANELIKLAFEPPDLVYEFRAMQIFGEAIPKMKKGLLRSYGEYKDTIEKLLNDKVYLMAVYDMINGLGAGGAGKVIRSALGKLKAKNIGSPSIVEMFVSLTEASYELYDDRRAVRTLGALAMASGHTGGTMQRKKMRPVVDSFLSSDYERKKQIVQSVKDGNFQ